MTEPGTHAIGDAAATVDHAAAEHTGHIASLGSYFAVWGALMFLTAATVACSRLDLGALNLPLALGIASIKAALVALFFMHLFYDDKFNLAVLVTGLIFVAIFCALTVTDMLSRGAINPREQHEIRPPSPVQVQATPPQ
jgi:cytochrome c oxidase subunit 4